LRRTLQGSVVWSAISRGVHSENKTLGSSILCVRCVK